MSRLGLMECNRCRMLKLQDQAQEEGLLITKRQSLYGIKKGVPGIDIYIHPKSTEIPSSYKFNHEHDMNSVVMMAAMLPDNDPDKWFAGWFPAIPDKCVCKKV